MVTRILLLTWNMMIVANTVPEPYPCPHEDGLFYATNEACNFYYRCENRILRSGVCFPWQKFDVHTMTCAKLKEVDCNPDYAGVWRAVYPEIPEAKDSVAQVQGGAMVQERDTLEFNREQEELSKEEFSKGEKAELDKSKIIFDLVLNKLIHFKMRNNLNILNKDNTQNIEFEEEIVHTFIRKRQVNLEDSLKEKYSKEMYVPLLGEKLAFELQEKSSKMTQGHIVPLFSQAATDTKQQTPSAGYWHWCGSGRYVFTSNIEEGNSICLSLQDPESLDKEDTQTEGGGHTFLGSNTNY